MAGNYLPLLDDPGHQAGIPQQLIQAYKTRRYPRDISAKETGISTKQIEGETTEWQYKNFVPIKTW